MKKYEKPIIQFESFVLSEHIADCGWELQSGDTQSCHAIGDTSWGYPDDVKGFTVNVVTTCDVEPEGYCYTNSSANLGLFRS